MHPLVVWAVVLLLCGSALIADIGHPSAVSNRSFLSMDVAVRARALHVVVAGESTGRLLFDGLRHTLHASSADSTPKRTDATVQDPTYGGSLTYLWCDFLANLTRVDELLCPPLAPAKLPYDIIVVAVGLHDLLYRPNWLEVAEKEFLDLAQRSLRPECARGAVRFVVTMPTVVRSKLSESRAMNPAFSPDGVLSVNHMLHAAFRGVSEVIVSDDLYKRTLKSEHATDDGVHYSSLLYEDVTVSLLTAADAKKSGVYGTPARSFVPQSKSHSFLRESPRNWTPWQIVVVILSACIFLWTVVVSVFPYFFAHGLPLLPAPCSLGFCIGASRTEAVVDWSLKFCGGYGSFMIILLCCVWADSGYFSPRGDVGWSDGKYWRLDEVFLCLIGISYFACTNLVRSGSAKADHFVGILAREQSEEVKGVMQILFLLYHYFSASHWYNWIRLCVATYVFFTGYGNSVYFLRTGDYSLSRVLRSLFRINLFAAFICAFLGEPYLWYYICAVHTVWFLITYAVCFVGSLLADLEKQQFRFLGLLSCVFVLSYVIMEDFSGFQFLFWPMRYTLEMYGDNLYEVWFRLHLDYPTVFVGILCGYYRDSIDRALATVEAFAGNWISGSVLAAIGAGMIAMWYITV